MTTVQKANCLRPKDTPEAKAALAPLNEQRNAVMEEKSVVVERKFAAIRRGDTVAAQAEQDRWDVLNLEEERLSREMRPHQDQIS
jgi:hypothetical protein